MRWVRRRVNYANVVASIALFLDRLFAVEGNDATRSGTRVTGMDGNGVVIDTIAVTLPNDRISVDCSTFIRFLEGNAQCQRNPESGDSGGRRG